MTPAPPTPARTRSLAACVATLALLAACGTGGTGGTGGASSDGPHAKGAQDAKGGMNSRDGRNGKDGRLNDQTGRPAAGSVITPTATAPVPHGKGSRLPDDINGDGYPDLQLPVPSGKGALPSRIAFVHGSAHGLDPATRTVLSREDLGLPSHDVTVAGATEVATADFDGDGYADVTTTAGSRLGKAETERTHATVRTRPYVSWGGPGGPGGPRHTRSAARVQLTGPDDSVDPQRPTVGDFNGDGHHDLALVRADRRSLLVLYGPFSRAGKAARTVPYRSPLGARGSEIGDLVADKIKGDRPTDLVVHALDDQEQSGSVLLTATSRGLRHTGRALRRGNSITFGDFDGDGRRDVAVGDSGTRNDEPGKETERPGVGKTVSVYPGGRYPGGVHAKGTAGDGGSVPQPIKVPKLSGALAAADTNGDGTDELIASLGSGGAEILTVRPHSPGETTRRRTATRTVPARVDGKPVRRDERSTRLYGVADFDHDGKDEIVLDWGRGLPFALYGERPERWWITDGTANRTAFTSRPFAADG